MPRRDQISEDKKQRLQQEQEHLQKLMFDARSSVRRSSLKGHGDKESENRLYPPLRTNPDASDDGGGVAARPKPVDRLWPKLGNRQQKVEAQAEKPAAQKKLLTEKDLFPTGERLADAIEQQEPLLETVEQKGDPKPPLTEQDLFPASDSVTDLPRQPQERIIKVILPEQNTALSTTPFYVNPVEKESARKTDTLETPVFRQERVEQPEEQQPVYTAEKATKKDSRSKAGFYAAALLAALLLGFGGYYFYMKSQQDGSVLADKGPEPVPVPASKTPVPPSADGINDPNENTAKTEPVKPTGTVTKKEPLKEPVKKPTAKSPVAVTEKSAAPVETTNADLGQYKVISKAYFHNEPDETTRRKAFIIHWNNAVLTPLEEKSGFIYIVFTNHLGQTSKGWLRKKDLRRLN